MDDAQRRRLEVTMLARVGEALGFLQAMKYFIEHDAVELTPELRAALGELEVVSRGLASFDLTAV